MTCKCYEPVEPQTHSAPFLKRCSIHYIQHKVFLEQQFSLLIKVSFIYCIHRWWCIIIRGKAAQGINFKLPGANFWRTHSRRETQGVCLALQISPGKREAGAALQGAKTSISEVCRREVSKRNSHRIDGVFHLSAPLLCISVLWRSAAYGGFSPDSFKYCGLFLMARWVKSNFLTCAVLTGDLSWTDRLLVLNALHAEGGVQGNKRWEKWVRTCDWCV